MTRRYPADRKLVNGEPDVGAYGFRIAGVSTEHAGAAKPGWPLLAVTRERGADPAPEPAGTLDEREDGLTVWLADGGRIDLDRESGTVHILAPWEVSDAAVMHPYLGLPAAFAAHWLGRHTLHGGAFLRPGGAWALLGDKAAGKSSTLGCLLRRGHAVVTDDILVAEGTTLFAGPRAVDLRPEAAGRLGGRDLGIVGARPRWRLDAGVVAPSVPLRGVIQLAWGDRIAVEPLAARERLLALIEHSVLRPGPPEALRLLELAALEGLRFVRPRDLDGLEAGVDQLLAALPA